MSLEPSSTSSQLGLADSRNHLSPHALGFVAAPELIRQ